MKKIRQSEKENLSFKPRRMRSSSCASNRS